jgi:hypothetical protein
MSNFEVVAPQTRQECESRIATADEVLGRAHLEKLAADSRYEVALHVAKHLRRYLAQGFPDEIPA